MSPSASWLVFAQPRCCRCRTLPRVDSCQVIEGDNAKDQGLNSRSAETGVEAHLTQHSSASKELHYSKHVYMYKQCTQKHRQLHARSHTQHLCVVCVHSFHSECMQLVCNWSVHRCQHTKHTQCEQTNCLTAHRH